MYAVSDPLFPSAIIIVAGLILAIYPSIVITRDGATVLSPGSAFASSGTPKLSDLIFHIQEFIIPGNNDSIPLYPLYVKNRDVIWTGDTQIDSSRILEFNLTSGKFTEHKLNGTSIVTVMAFDHNNNNQIWYVDPLLKRLGHYNLSANSTKLFDIPTQGIIARIALD